MQYISRVFIVVMPLLMGSVALFMYSIQPYLIEKYPVNHELYGLFILACIAVFVAMLTVTNTVRKFIMPFEQISASLEWVEKGEFKQIPAEKYPLVASILEDYNDTMNLILEKERSLMESYRELKELDTKKTNFINVVSHELRTPMTVIKGYISMLLDGDVWPISEEVKIYLERVYSGTTLLLKLVNDMLDIAKMESGKMTFHEETFSYKEFLNGILLDIEQLAHKKFITLTSTADFEDIEVLTDKQHFGRVLINILWNAVKFTPNKGNIQIHSYKKDEALCISISDTGIGIAEDKLTTIFDKFSQIDNPLTRDIEGTGLWLFICKKIMDSLGGEITVESTPGKWSTFTIILQNYCRLH